MGPAGNSGCSSCTVLKVASTTRSIARGLFFVAVAIFVIVLVFGVWLGTLVF